MAIRISTGFLYFICAICALLLWYTNEGYANLDGGETKQNHYYNFQIGSLQPESVCNNTSINDNIGMTSLKVIHRHGPCSPLNKDKMETPKNVYQILSNDQVRVDSIHSQLNINSDQKHISNPHAELPGKRGTAFHSEEYIVTLGLGTPKHDLTFFFDTGSDVTWTQCQPCKKCYNQTEPIFDPSKSTTYRTVACNSTLCTALYTHPLNCMDDNVCPLNTSYIDGSYTLGNFALETLALTSAHAIVDYLFQCSHSAEIDFGTIAGIFGLNKGELSFVSQTASTYGQYFSYCLPSTPSATGHLTFGPRKTENSLQFTPFVLLDTSLYVIEILGIKVGDILLQISESVFSIAGTIIDSGTTITFLPPDAYFALRTAFREAMASYYMTEPFFVLDTCYYLDNLSIVYVPRISFIFGENIEIPLNLPGILFEVRKYTYCLPFASNQSPTQAAIFGNLQQRTLDVVYDVPGGKLGFGLNGCL